MLTSFCQKLQSFPDIALVAAVKINFSNTSCNLQKAVTQIYKFESEFIGWIRKLK